MSEEAILVVIGRRYRNQFRAVTLITATQDPNGVRFIPRRLQVQSGRTLKIDQFIAAVQGTPQDWLISEAKKALRNAQAYRATNSSRLSFNADDIRALLSGKSSH